MPAEESVVSAANDPQTRGRIVVRLAGVPRRCRQTQHGQHLSESTNVVMFDLVANASMPNANHCAHQVDTRSGQSFQKYFFDLVANTKAE